MEKDDIRVTHVIIHILDSTVGTAVLSNSLLEHGSDFSDFVRSHIYRIMMSDEGKACTFDGDSPVYQMVSEMEEDTFIAKTQEIAQKLFDIMYSNIDIPSADLMVVRYDAGQQCGIALLKMNYKSSYTHMTNFTDGGNCNDIIRQNAILPGENQKLSEAALIDLNDYSLRVIEKKYEVNGVKTNYFTQVFLQCHGSMSPKTELAIVSRAVEQVQNSYYDESEQWEARMEAKSIISQELAEQGAIDIPTVAEKIFHEKPELKEEFKEKMEKYNLSEKKVEPQNPATTRKFEKQYLTTDTGIEIKIPMEEYQNKDSVEFITNADGSISVLIKNIGSITSR